MKSKAQKQSELKKGGELLEKSSVLLFADFTKVKTHDVRRLRQEFSGLGIKVMVMKKRLLNVLMKERHLDFDARQFKLSVATVFSPSGIEETSGTLFKFFKTLGAGVEKEKILGGYDVAKKQFIDADTVRMIGQLPPREVLLAQLAGMIAAPIRSLLYVLSEKAKRS